jgi:hypothetical protein
MFSKLKVNIPIRAPIQRLVVSNDIILVALNNNSIYRIDQRQPDKCEGMKLVFLVDTLSAGQWTLKLHFFLQNWTLGNQCQFQCESSVCFLSLTDSTR